MPYSIVPASPEHLPYLAAIERAANQMFPAEDLADALRNTVCDPALLLEAQEAGRLFVALVNEEPVGSALTIPVDECLHLAELGVHPEHGRKGIGRALLAQAIRYAAGEGYAAVTLTTFRHLAWNAPFYESAGFRALEENELSPYLLERLEEERAEGFDLSRRVAMRYEIQG